MLRRRKGQSFFLRIIWTYVLIVLVVLMFGALLTECIMLKSSWNELDKAGQMSLDQTVGTIDGQIRMLNNIAQIMSEDSGLTTAAVSMSPISYSTFLKLQEYSYLIDIMQDVFLYYASPAINSYFYSPKGIFRKEFFDISYDGYGISANYIINNMKNIDRPTWDISEDISGNKTLVYIYPLTKDQNGTSRAAFFVLKSETLFRMLTQSFEDNSSASVWINKNMVLTAQNGNVMEEVPTKETYKAFSYSSGLNFTVSVPQTYRVISESVMNILIMVLGSALMTSVVILIVSLAKKTSKPIQELETDMKSGITQEQATGYRELDTIRQIYKQIHQENKKISDDIDQQSRLLRSNLLLSMIHGRLGDVNGEYLHSAMGLAESYCVYTMIMVLVDKNDSENDANQVVKFFMALASPKLSIASTNMMPSKFAMILMAEPENRSRSSLHQLLRNAQEEICNSLGMTVTLVCSPSFESLEDVRSLYHEMRDAAQYRVIVGGNSLIDMTQLPEIEERTVEKETGIDELIQMCEIPDAEGADKILNRILDQRCWKPDLIALRSTCYSILSALKDEGRKLYEDGYVGFNNFIEPDTLEEARIELGKQVRSLCYSVKTSKNNPHLTLCNSILLYMEENYSNPNLTPSMIAEHFDISLGYLFRTFKAQKGNYVAAMLDQIRMREAKRLLVETNIPVKNIVVMAGYVDVSNFIRKFKRQEGETPLAYRKRLGEGARSRQENLSLML